MRLMGSGVGFALRRPVPLRVAIVAPSTRILGGQAVQAQRLLDGWRNDPDVKAWLVPINPERPHLRPLLARKYVRTVVTQALYWPLLLRGLRDADVVHIFSASYSSFVLSPLPAVLVARWLGKPVLFNYHSGEAPDHLRRSALARRVLRSVDVNVVPSVFLQRVFQEHGIGTGVIANVAVLDRFKYRERHPLRPRLLSTRNFAPIYNVAATLRAFARIQERYPEASLTVVGRGSQEPYLKSLAGELRLRNVTFTGAVAQDQIHRYYDDADIYVQTPSIDNMPLSVIEAFASGLPVVSTDVGGIPTILTHGVHGLLSPHDDDQSIAENVIRLIESPAEAQRMAEAARATCRAYEWSLLRDQWLAAYQSLAGTAVDDRREAA
jgi:glycosyltransferase involved in cell wall biosynthesis